MAARSHPRGALVWLAIVAAACSAGGPIPPTAPGAPNTTVLTGQVVDQFTDAGLPDVRVEFAGASAVTDASGRFAIVGTPSAAVRLVTLKGASIHTRETYAADGEARFQVLPVTYDMTAFEDVGRERDGRTVRWLRPPTIYLDTRVTGPEPDAAEMALWIGEVQSLAPALVEEWTGGAWAGAPVVVGTSPPASGAIVLAFNEDAAAYPGERVAGVTYVGWSTGGAIDWSRVRLRFSELAGPSGAFARKAVLAHELGHALGIGHMDGATSSVMAPIIRTPILTAFDRTAGRVLYARPPGNASVDRDTQPKPSAGLAPAGVPAGAAEWSCQAVLP